MARRTKHKRRSAKTETDKWCSRYIRMKAACELNPIERLGRCYTCGVVKDVAYMDSGHYKSRGSRGHSGLYFDERCIRLQCKRCNGFEGGKPAEFREGLVREYGEDVVQELERLHLVKSYTEREIYGLGIYFRSEVARMIAEQGVRPWWRVRRGEIV